jgi:hypothetical protein
MTAIFPNIVLVNLSLIKPKKKYVGFRFPDPT